MTTNDYQLLFGVLSLQLEIITVEQFAEACTIWAMKKDRPLPDLLADRGWLKEQDRTDIDRLLRRKIARHGGDVPAALREAADHPRVRASLAGIDNAEIHHTLLPTPPPHGVAIVATRAYVPTDTERYTLSRLHATGGIGRVWLAHDVSLRREVALKELRPERAGNEVVQTRFLREARITGQLEHPGIVPIYEVGQRPDDKAPFYTMRFIRGQTMAEAADEYHCKKKEGTATAIDLRKLLSAFIGVCNATAYAHSRGVLHRDLKPQNVVLGAFGEVIVLDWGLAKVTDDSDEGPVPLDFGSADGVAETRPGQAIGTPAYMSPEQALGRHDLMGHTTDVYGLGAVLYHILTSQPPFPALSQDDAMENVIKDPPKPPREVNPDAPPALAAICVKALSKDPKARYQSATELADEVQHWLADEPVRVFAEPVAVRAARWMRRHKPFVSAAAVFLVCATLAAGGASVMFYREQQLAKREEKAAQEAKDAAVREQMSTDRGLVRTFTLLEAVMTTADADLGRGLVNTFPARQKIIYSSVAAMNDIREERPRDERVAKTLAMLHQYASTTKRMERLPTEAENELKQSISLLEPLVAKYADEPAHAALLASAHSNLAAQYRLVGRRRDAYSHLDRAIELSETHAKKGDASSRRNLALAVNERSIAEFGWKPMAETEATALRAVQLLRELLEGKKAEELVVYQWFLSGALNRVAGCRRELGRPADGLKELDESAQMMTNLLTLAPTDRNSAHARAHSWLQRARSLAEIPGREKEALREFEQAIATWKPVRGYDVFEIAAASAFVLRAEFHRRQANEKLAEDDLAAAEKLLEELPKPSRTGVDYLTWRARIDAARTKLALNRKDADAAGKHLAAARTAYDSLLKSDSDNTLERRHLQKLEEEAQRK